MRNRTYQFNRDPKDQRRIDIPDEEIIRAHLEYYQAGESMKAIGKRFGVGRVYISRRFKKLGLPIAHHIQFRKWTPPTD